MAVSWSVNNASPALDQLENHLIKLERTALPDIFESLPEFPKSARIQLQQRLPGDVCW